MHRRKPVLLADAAIERLVLGMRMDVYEAGNHGTLGAVDDPVRRTGVIVADVGDAVVGKGEIEIAAVDVPPRRLVPGNHPGGVLDHSGRHRFASLRFAPML